MDTREEIKNHIAKGEPDKAIKLLLNYSKENIPDIHDEALLLSGQYRQWKRGITLGVEQSSAELRRIEVGVLDLLNNQETYVNGLPHRNDFAAVAPGSTKTKTEKSNLTSILLGVFGTISIGFIALLAIGAQEPAVAVNENPVEMNEEAGRAQEQPSKTVFGGGLTVDQFDNMLNNYNESMQDNEPSHLDINTVIQVRYTTGERIGYFESVANSSEWIERNDDSNEIVNRYEEEGRFGQTISLFSESTDRFVFLSLEDDKVYEKVGAGKKYHIFNIIGVY